MRTRSLILAAAAVAVVLWLVFDRPDRHTSQREIRQLQAKLDELKTELRNRPLAALGTEAATTQLARREARAEAQRAIDEQSTTDGARPAKPPPVTFEQSQAAVLEAFGQEASDPQWSTEATRKLDAAIRDQLPKGSHLGSIECHTTMCRVELRNTDPGVGQRSLMSGFRTWPGSLFVTQDRQDQGEQVVTIIAAREGYEPPMGPR